MRDSVNAVLVQQLINAYLLHVRAGAGQVASALLVGRLLNEDGG